MRKEIREKAVYLETPCYVYDAKTIEKNIDRLVESFKRCDAQFFFAVKANTSHAVLRVIKNAGIGAEVVSPGELYIALHAGFKPRRILYNNIARKQEDILYAIKRGIVYYNFEAIDQALLLEACAKKTRKRIKLFARINPGIFSDTHPHLSTGAPSSKFGIECIQLAQVAKMIADLRYADFTGIHSHIGSQILSSRPFIRGVKKVSEFIDFFKKRNITVRHVNLGGGFGIPYHPEEKMLNLAPIARAYGDLKKYHNVAIFLEPGRSIVGNAGFIVTRVMSIKQRKNRMLYIIDAGMTENPRPALYEAYHHIEAIRFARRAHRKARVVGPLCENSDEFGLFSLPPLELGKTLIIHNCGAYTRTMASNYNGRLLPAEYLYVHGRLRMIRKKQLYKQLIMNEDT